MGDHFVRCGRCSAIIAGGKEFGDHMDYHDRQDKKEAMNREIGNVLDHWEQLPNDIRTDVGFESLESALVKLRNSVEH